MDDLFNAVMRGNIFDNIILNKISMKDAYKLRLVNSTLRKRMSKNYFYNIMKNRIENKLKSILGINYIPFIKTMIECKAILSGSFIHQCVLNESWENSDIDIYTEKRSQYEKFDKFLKSISIYNDSSNEMYKNVFSCIDWIENYYIDNKNTIPYSRDEVSHDMYRYNDSYICRDDKLKELNNNIKNCIKFQLVRIKTTKEYTLHDHIRNTGFEVCKNLAYYTDKMNLYLDLSDYKEILFKRTTFTIQNIDDFYYRIEKYSKRNFNFKSKYNKLLYLEYLYINFCHVHILKTNFNENIFESIKGKKCGVNCPMKLFFRNVRHYHTELEYDRKSDDDNGGRCYYRCHDIAKVTTVDNTDGTFNGILPQLTHCGRNPGKNELMTRETLESFIYKCENIDQYAKKRNEFTKKQMNIYSRTKEYKYDIQFGLASNYPQKSKDDNKKENKTKDNKTKDGWTVVKYKK